jgi:hypothetical protein
MKRIILTVVGLAVVVAGVLVFKHFHEQGLAEEDERINAANDDLRFFPKDLKCAPSFEGFETALRYAVNESPITAVAMLDEKNKRKVNFDTDIEGGSGCDAELLRSTLRKPRVNRLLKHCGITELACVRQGKAIEITW